VGGLLDGDAPARWSAEKPGAVCLLFQQPQFPGLGDRLESIGDLQFGKEVMQVRFDRAGCHHEHPGYVLRGAALGEQEQHVTLTLGGRLDQNLAFRLELETARPVCR